MVKEEYKKNEKNVVAQEWLDSEYPKEKKILERKKENIVKLDISREGLEGDLKLEDFAGLNDLECDDNKLTHLEIINCPKLEVVYCRDNQIIELKIQNCPSLKRIYCERNKLIELNLSKLKSLTGLYCHDNQLMKLELSNCSNLEWLDCYNNQLIFLNLANCLSLENVDCHKNQLTSLKFSNLPKLKRLIGYQNKLNNLDLSNNLQLERIDCNNNQLNNLNLTENKNLTELDLSNNQLTSLDLTNCKQLKRLDCCDNNLQDLFLPFQGEHLNYLDVKSNNFPEQDLSIFRRFVNLQQLIISNEDEKKVSQGIYNRFTGSLEPLQKMNVLYKLKINNTDISSGLTYLSESVDSCCCLTNLRDNAQVKVIAKLLVNEKGDNFSQKLRSIKQGEFRPRIDQAIFLVEQRRITNKISTSDLWKELKVSYKVGDDASAWQDYLKPTLSLDDLNIRKENILKVLKHLQEVADAKEKQFQEELNKRKEELEKRIKELEAKQLTENEKKILRKLEELFNTFGQFGKEGSEDNKELAKVIEDYQKLDFTTDTPNLSTVFKSGGENLFSQVDTFIKETNLNKQKNESQEELKTEVIQLQTELEKAKENCQELVVELVKKDSEISETLEKKEKLQLKIDNLQKRIQKDEEELRLFPQKIDRAEKAVKKHIYGTTETTAPLWKEKDALEKEEKKLQQSVEKAKSELIKSKKEENILQKQLDKAKNNSDKEAINKKIKNKQEQIEKLERELNSQLETQNIIAQIEVNK